MFSQTIFAGPHRIGSGQRCFIAAEVGINHNGDMGIAHRAIDVAADLGVDAVKFQNYHTEDFVGDSSLELSYIATDGAIVTVPQYELFKRCELGKDQLRELKRHCDDRGVTFFSTPTSSNGVAELLSMGVTLLKNGSDFLTDLEVVRAMAVSGRPTVLSTGMATVGEIDECVSAFRDAGGREIVLLHCTSSYPTPPQEVNLRRMSSLAGRFGCPVGFSDHTQGTTASVGAVALGACFVEKHFTLDRDLPGPDHRFSADPIELAELVVAIRTLETSFGSGEIVPAPSEDFGRHYFRLSCAAGRELVPGDVLSISDIALSRPGTGISPLLREKLAGRRLSHRILKGQQFSWEDFE